MIEKEILGIQKRKLPGSVTEFLLLTGNWVSVRDIMKRDDVAVDRKTLNGRITTHFCKGRNNSKFKTIEDMFQLPKTKVYSRAKVENKYKPDLFDTLSTLM